MVINHRHYLCMRRDQCLTLSCKKRYNGIPFSKATERQFADNEGVAEQPVILNDFA